MSYAEGTTVSAAKSRAEIEDMLTRAGATRFMTSLETGRAVIMFELKGRAVKFEIAFPKRDDTRFTHAKPRGQWSSPKRRPEPAAAAAHDDECRRLWRCLALAIKSKLSAIADGISTFDVEFMPFIVLAGGKTIGETIIPHLQNSANVGTLPALPWSGA